MVLLFLSVQFHLKLRDSFLLILLAVCSVIDILLKNHRIESKANMILSLAVISCIKIAATLHR